MAVPESYEDNPQARPNPGLISKTRQDIGSSLIAASFGILGSTIAQDRGDPSMAAPFTQLGNNIANALTDRWHKQEYENFQAQYVQSYTAAANAISGNLQMQMGALDRGELIQPDGSITKINVKGEGFLRTKDTIIRQSMTSLHKINDQFLQDAGKYATNPYISGVAQNLMQSISGRVADVTGPTPGMESEEQYMGMRKAEQDINQSKAYERYLNRMPSGGGSGSSKENKRGDPRALLEELGPYGFMEMLTGSEMGYDLLGPYKEMAQSQVSNKLIQDDPNLRYDTAQLELRMKESNQAIQQRAAGLYMKTVFPELASELGQIEKFAPNFPGAEEVEPPKPTVTGEMPKAEEDEAMTTVYDAAVTQIDGVIRNRNPKSLDQAVNIVMREWFPKFINQFAQGKATAKFRRVARDRVSAYISDVANLEGSPIAQEKFGTKKGILDRIGESVKEAEKYGKAVGKQGLF